MTCEGCKLQISWDSRSWAIVWDGEKWSMVRYAHTMPLGPYHGGCISDELNRRNKSYVTSDDRLPRIKANLENLEYERHGSTREDIAWLIAEVERFRGGGDSNG